MTSKAEIADMDPYSFLALLVQKGMFDGNEEALEHYKKLADRGIHPLELLSREPDTEEVCPPCLEVFDIDGIAKYAMKHRCRNVVVLCGAGISTAAGIPDFRTPGTGLYDNLARFDLPTPQSIFTLEYFREKPAAFYELAKELWPGQWTPTLTHYLIRLLHEKGILRRCYTQNIDSLERLAGIPDEKIVAAHGNFDRAHVIDTNPPQEVDTNVLKAALDRGEEGWAELRAQMGDLVKPDIVFFGEELPKRFSDLSHGDLWSCDLLIVMGTSLAVQPFSGLLSLVSRSAPRLLINRDAVGLCGKTKAGFRFHLEGEDNWRDVWYQGTCDDGCKQLAEAFDWQDDLKNLMTSAGAAPSGMTIEPASWLKSSTSEDDVS